MHIQLWSYNYEPEPTGIAPISAAWARETVALGHSVDVVAAHPHYPEPAWGSQRLPYVEERDGVNVLRLPLWAGRQTPAQRLRQELSFTIAVAGAVPFLSKPDVMVAVSPSFPALLPAMLHARVRERPWVLWIQDLLPEGAVITGQMRPGLMLNLSRRLERRAYTSAARIIVISETFRRYLLGKGVPADDITRIYNPATIRFGRRSSFADTLRKPRVLCMGNIGHSQGLVEIVRAYQDEDVTEPIGARLEIAGSGVAVAAVQRAQTSRVTELLGLLVGEELEAALARATLGAVTQRYEGTEFNVPSKLMNYYACGIPVVASVRPDSEIARLVRESGGGWVSDAKDPSDFARVVRRVLKEPRELELRSAAALKYARAEFRPSETARRAARVLAEVIDDRSR